jgi:hypothetical protein
MTEILEGLGIVPAIKTKKAVTNSCNSTRYIDANLQV